MRKTFKYRLYPTKAQKNVLERTLGLCCDLYNCALEERISAYNQKGISLSYNNQQNELPLLVEECPEYKDVFSQVRQDVLRRLEKSYQAFFRRLKIKGAKAGFPRFRGKHRYDSFTYPQSGFSLEDNGRLYLSKIGSVKIRLHRSIVGKIKTCTIKREVDQWFVSFSCEVPDAIGRQADWNNDVGLDVGLEVFYYSSDKEKVENPRYMKRAKKKLRRAQRSLSRKVRGNNNRKKQRVCVAKQHRSVSRKRYDFLHQIARRLVDRYDVFYMEDLCILNMLKNRRLAFHIADVSWGKFMEILVYKAEEAGKQVIFVDPRGTSQRCSQCGNIVTKDLSIRIHDCPYCGFRVSRDYDLKPRKPTTSVVG